MGDFLYLMGWGKNEYSKSESIEKLLFANVTLIDGHKGCLRLQRSKSFIYDKMLCTKMNRKEHTFTKSFKMVSCFIKFSLKNNILSGKFYIEKYISTTLVRKIR